MLAIGRLTEQKGFDVLIHAFSELFPRYPDWRLTILGDGPLRPDLERLRDNLGLVGLVEFPGEVKHIHQYLQYVDVFVLSSRYEGFPNSLCEAMACGLAVVATDCQSGPGEIIEDGINGLLAVPNDVHSLASCMDRLMSNEVERKRLGNNASRITERFEPGKILEMWESLVKEVVQGT
jgi:glycosyltransferase involved in cell wall biosynthesis